MTTLLRLYWEFFKTGLFAVGGFGVVDGVMQTVPATSVMSYSLSAVPLFILMAHLLMLSGLLDSLFDAARAIVGRIRGGTAVASIGAGTRSRRCPAPPPRRPPRSPRPRRSR